jgi:phosphopentomutase
MLCLEEFDLLAHEKKPTIYIKRLKELDSYIGKIKFNMAEDDLLILTADHGCNPILDMRGHTREYVPIIIFSKKLINKKIWLGKRSTFADLGQTILYNFGLDLNKHGEPIYEIF